MGPRRRMGKTLCAVVALVALAPGGARAGVNVWTSAGPSIPFDGRMDTLAVDPVRVGTLHAATMAGVLYRTSDGGATWSRSSSSAVVTALAVGPTGIAYAATRSGELRSNDGGRTWQQIRPPGLGTVLSIQVDPNDDSVAYLTTVRSGSILEGDLLRSPDACLTWISIREGLGPGYVRAFAIDRFDSRRLYAVSESGFFVSADSGGHWTRATNGLPTAEIGALAVDPNSRGRIYAGGAAGIFRSSDSGASFSRVGADLPGPFVRSVVVDPVAPGRVFAAVDGNGVHVSTDGGDTWRPFGDGLRGDFATLAIHPAGRSIHAATTEGVFDHELVKTAAPLVLDRDRPFQLRLTARDPRSGRLAVGDPIRQRDGFGYFSVPDLTSDPDDPEVVVKLLDSRESGGSVSIFHSALTDLEYELSVTEDDSGQTWKYSSACGGHAILSPEAVPDLSKVTVQTAGRWASGGPPAREAHALVVDPTNPQTLYVAASETSSRSVYRSTNGGGTWVPTGLPRPVSALTAGSGVVYAVGGNAFFRSTDGGRNWRETPVFSGHRNPDNSGFGVLFLRVDPDDPDVVYMGTVATISPGGTPPSGVLLRTRDGGMTWHGIQDPWDPLTGLGFGVVTDLAIDPDRPATIHAVKESGYYRSDDRGRTWARMYLPLRDATALALDPRFEGVIYVGGGAGLFKSIDSGRSFSRIGVGLPGLTGAWPSRIVVDPSRSSRVFAGTYGRGVFVSEDGGETWADFNEGLGNLGVRDLAMHAGDGILHAATIGGVFHNRFAAESATLSLSAAHPFRVRLSVRNQRTGQTSEGHATPLDDLFGYFTVPGLTTHVDNPEVVVKIVDGRAVNGAFWVFHGALTDLEYTLTVTEEATGRVKTYSKPAGSACGGIDTSAFGP